MAKLISSSDNKPFFPSPSQTHPRAWNGAAAARKSIFSPIFMAMWIAWLAKKRKTRARHVWRERNSRKSVDEESGKGKQTRAAKAISETSSGCFESESLARSPSSMIKKSFVSFRRIVQLITINYRPEKLSPSSHNLSHEMLLMKRHEALRHYLITWINTFLARAAAEKQGKSSFRKLVFADGSSSCSITFLADMMKNFCSSRSWKEGGILNWISSREREEWES
jgi:hypothetical protein